MRLGRRHRGGRLASVGAAAVALALGATLAVGAPASAGQQSPPGAAKSADPSRTVDVMTRNLYLGADLTPVILALAFNPPTSDPVRQAASATWAAVQASDPEERMAAIADEIVAARPALVGLQEVTRWTTYSSTFTPTVRYDFLDLLLKALADRGVVYHEVDGATSDNFTSPPIPLAAGSGAAAVSLSDRDVILRRDDVKTWNAHHGNFTNILSFPLADGTTLPVARGWGSVDARTKLATFRFVNSHLEAFGIPGVDAEGLRTLQVGELFDAQDAITAESGGLPAVYVGDYNSVAPNASAYKALDQRLDDAWIAANGSDPGYTCCQDGTLTNTVSQLDERIDLVMTSPTVDAVRAYRTGTTPVDLPGDTNWASDHAGVVARLVIPRTAATR
jgi:endonuclease/exonuclease/phosphatase family metal-dependent hydrolase